MQRALLTILLAQAVSTAGGIGGRAEYVGGTAALFDSRQNGRLQTVDNAVLRFETKNRTVEVPYERIHTLEYGQKVDRRYISAVLISPLLLMAKSRKHFLTIAYADRDGRSQALIFKIEKNDVRAVLAGLEARTGRRITYQDEQTRKAGKG